MRLDNAGNSIFHSVFSNWIQSWITFKRGSLCCMQIKLTVNIWTWGSFSFRSSSSLNRSIRLRHEVFIVFTLLFIRFILCRVVTWNVSWTCTQWMFDDVWCSLCTKIVFFQLFTYVNYFVKGVSRWITARIWCTNEKD